MKKYLAILLALTMLLSLGVMAHADEHEHETATEIGEQIAFLAARFEGLRQADDEGTWYYAVTDLDHNGRLELLANRKDAAGRSALKVWELSPNGRSLVICTRNTIPAPVGSEEKDLVLDSMMLSLLSNSVDTHYDKETDTYYYTYVDSSEFHGFVTPNGEFNETDGVLTGVGATSMKSGSIAPSIILGSCVTYEEGDGDLKVICRDGKGNEVGMLEFLSLSLGAFPELPRFSTAFDWFTADEAATLQRFVNSYATFDGVLDQDRPKGGVAPVSSQSAGGVYITKNPTDEKHNDGETAEFIANANIYDDVTWTFIAPDGRTYNEQEFVKMCGGIPEGTKTGDLRIKNVNTDMNGWGVFATFDYRGASARTSTAYLYVWAGGSSNNLGEQIDAFYREKPFLNPGGWTCPKCGGWATGSECWSCGFNPVAFYSIYYGVTPTGYDWYYGVNGQTPVSELSPNPFAGVLAWICPVCGESSQNVMYCWSCGYHYGDPLDPVVVNNVRERLMGADLRKCEYCGNWFNSDYDVCPYCGIEPNDGTAYDATQWNTVVEMYQGAELRQCDCCGEWFNSDYDVCPYCRMAPDDGTYYTDAEINTYQEFLRGADLIMCRFCGQWFNSDYDRCPHCGNEPDNGYHGDGSFAGYTEGGNARYTHYDEYGNEYATVICPYCGWEHSMAINCPNCGNGYS